MLPYHYEIKLLWRSFLFIILKLDISIGENSWKKDSCMKLSLSELHNSYCIT